MTRYSKDIYEDKLTLIYEHDNASPLFIRAASQAASKENFSKAVEILKSGLKIFPNYPTAHILLGKVYTMTEKYDLAEESFRKGINLINSPETLNYYIREIENYRNKNTSFTQSRRVAFFQDNLKEIIKEDAKPELHKNTSTDDTPEEIEKKLRTARIIPEQNESIPEIPTEERAKPVQKPIVSESMAKVYISQGHFKEALKVYEELLPKASPKDRAAYQKRIEEIRESIQGGDWL
ncbi:MAG: hypothetical protein WCJ01_00325 [Ignavibacteria bacterium]